ncbi:MAG TPA: UDP-N-acetylglucosamine 2-epimerase (non-hydrolyzing) [Anaerolineales bacterium]|nr:UDP-N-acetylglucosamine 2-epimerase (non-hydrolyzing) [Anaerolineales bacterium]
MAEPLRVLSVFGTRPEAIKMAPVVQQLGQTPGVLSRVCITAQHRQMLDQVLELFGLQPDYDLDLMKPDQPLNELTAAVFSGLEPVLRGFGPDWVLVQGDTTTVMAAGLSAYYHRVRVGHVEAGLRTGDKWQPFPEEINRKVLGAVADLHFAPTEWARGNLLREGVSEASIRVTGNPVIDALRQVLRQPCDLEAGPLRGRLDERKLLLVTAHRRENFGAPMERIFGALLRIAREFEPLVQLVYPVHMNPNVHEPAHQLLGGVANIHLIPPLDYLPMVHLMKRAYLVLTDSGGLQEEAPAVGTPVLVMREVTERPEALEAGTALLVGTDPERIYAEAKRLLENPQAQAAMARANNPYGDGHAAERIVAALLEASGAQAGG